MKTALDTQHILDRLEGQHPDADTELHFTTAFELLVATMLSAQSTDQGVNRVTPALFARYPNAAALAQASTDDLEPLIHATGFFRQKSRALLGMATALVAQHDGEVPADMAALTALPGVGRKTGNVVLGHALGVPGLPVDRHVLRVSNRIGIAEGDAPEQVEAQLCAALPKSRWTKTSDTLILHGRRICKPKPLCAECAVREDCLFFQSASDDQPAPETGRQSKTASATPPSGRPPNRPLNQSLARRPRPNPQTTKAPAATQAPRARATASGRKRR